VLQFIYFFGYLLHLQLLDHSILFARWLPQTKNERVPTSLVVAVVGDPRDLRGGVTRSTVNLSFRQLDTVWWLQHKFTWAGQVLHWSPEQNGINWFISACCFQVGPVRPQWILHYRLV